MSEKIQDRENRRRLFLKTAVAFFTSHIGGSLIAAIFCFGLSPLFTYGAYYVLIPAILLLYSYPIYSSMWNAGHRDRNAANFGHATFRYSRGLLYGIVGASPLAVISIGFVLSKFGLLFNFVLPYKMLINPEIWPIINMLEPTVFLPNFAVWEVLLIAFLSVAVPVLIGEFGYFMGARDISIVQKLVYKDNKKKER